MPERVIVFTMEKVGSSTVKWALEHGGYLVERAYYENADMIDWNGCKIVSVVRDINARNISWFFEANSMLAMPIHWMQNAWDRFPEVQRLEAAELLRDRLAHYTGIDVYTESFDKQRGWQIYDDRLLVIRTENFDEALFDALTTLLEVRPFVIDHRAKGEERFGPLYQQFLDEVEFSDESLEVAYNTKYMKHFYTDQEIKQFKKRWQHE